MDLYIFIFIAAVFIGIVLDRWYTWMRAQQHGMRMKVVMGVPTTIILENRGRTVEKEVQLRLYISSDSIDPPEVAIVSKSMKHTPAIYVAEQTSDDSGLPWDTWLLVIQQMRPKENLVLSVDAGVITELHAIATSAEISDSFAYPDAGGGGGE